MRQVLAKLTQIGWNQRPFNDLDFTTLCESEGVRVIEMALPQRGLYLVRSGVPVIVIDENLRGAEKLFVQFHELGHHLLHSPDTCFYSPGLNEKFQAQANLIAACALIPRPLLLSLTCAELIDEMEVSREIVATRIEIYHRLKI